MTIPQNLDLLKQLHIPRGDIEHAQLVNARLESWDGIVTGLGAGDDEQSAINVFLLGGELLGPLVDRLGVVAGSLLCAVQVAFGVFELDQSEIGLGHLVRVDAE